MSHTPRYLVSLRQTNADERTFDDVIEADTADDAMRKAVEAWDADWAEPGAVHEALSAELLPAEYDLGIGEDLEEDYEAALAQTFQMYQELEELHADRGLTIDRSGYGAVPVQVFGQLDGLHFYMRYRRDCAKLLVGPFDEALEDAVWELTEARRKEHLATRPTGTLAFLYEQETPRERPGHGYLPTRVTLKSNISSVKDATYCGSLDPEELAPLFSKLIAGLLPVPEDEQLPRYLVEALTGRGLWPLPQSSDDRAAGATQ